MTSTWKERERWKVAEDRFVFDAYLRTEKIIAHALEFSMSKRKCSLLLSNNKTASLMLKECRTRLHLSPLGDDAESTKAKATRKWETKNTLSSHRLPRHHYRQVRATCERALCGRRLSTTVAARTGLTALLLLQSFNSFLLLLLFCWCAHKRIVAAGNLNKMRILCASFYHFHFTVAQ